MSQFITLDFYVEETGYSIVIFSRIIKKKKCVRIGKRENNYPSGMYKHYKIVTKIHFINRYDAEKNLTYYYSYDILN